MTDWRNYGQVVAYYDPDAPGTSNPSEARCNAEGHRYAETVSMLTNGRFQEGGGTP